MFGKSRFSTTNRKTYKNLLKQNKKLYNNKNFKENTKQTQLFIYEKRNEIIYINNITMRIFNWEKFQSDFCLRKSIILYMRVNIGVGYKIQCAKTQKLENITTTFFSMC